MSEDKTGQQLVARIRRISKYWGQTAPNVWFDIKIVQGDHYCVVANSNRYRLSDVAIGVRFDDAVVDLSKSFHT